MSIQVIRVRHAWPVQPGFTINRPVGTNDYTFLHFHQSVLLRIDGKVQELAPGSCILYRPGTPQWFHSDGPMKHDWMHLTGDVAAALEETGVEANRVYLPENGRFITDLTRQVEREHFTQPAGSSLMMDLLVRQLLLELFRACNHPAESQQPKADLARRLFQLRDAVFSQPGAAWSVEKMARLCYLSPSRFHTVYRSVFGLSPTDDLIRTRIEKAKWLLTGSTESVKDISEALGYKNVTHFCRQFKTLTGLSPTQYRNSAQQPPL